VNGADELISEENQEQSLSDVLARQYVEQATPSEDEIAAIMAERNMTGCDPAKFRELSVEMTMQTYADGSNILANNPSSTSSSTLSWNIPEKPTRIAMKSATIVSSIFVVFACYLAFKVYRKREIDFRYGIRCPHNIYPVGRSARLVGMFAANAVFGSFLVSCMFGGVVFLLCWDKFWTWVDTNKWTLVSYTAYILFDVFVIHEWLTYYKLTPRGKHPTKEQFVYFRYFVFILESFYIPLCFVYAAIRFTWLLLFFVLSFLRPDETMFPFAFVELDQAHVTFIATTKLGAYRYGKLREEYMGKKNEQDVENSCEGGGDSGEGDFQSTNPI